MLISLWSVQDGTSDIISHAQQLGSTVCDPQHLIGCLVIQGKVDPVCGLWKICTHDSREKKIAHHEIEEKFVNLNDCSYILEDQLCRWAQGYSARSLGFFLSGEKIQINRFDYKMMTR